MTTFTNGQYFGWQQKTAPAAPYVATTYTRVIADFVPTIRHNGLTGDRPIVRTTEPPLLFDVVHRPGFVLPAWGSSLSGIAYSAGSPARRHIVVMTQPPRSQVVAEMKTDDVTGAFSTGARLPPGNYVVIDAMTDNSRQALVYDWVVVA